MFINLANVFNVPIITIASWNTFCFLKQYFMQQNKLNFCIIKNILCNKVNFCMRQTIFYAIMKEKWAWHIIFFLVSFVLDKNRFKSDYVA